MFIVKSAFNIKNTMAYISNWHTYLIGITIVLYNTINIRNSKNIY